MARATPELITALHTTADRLAGGDRYQWSHMGSCNCGHLAQTITPYSTAEIHASALQRSGDWSEQSMFEYCPGSGLTIDRVIEAMLEIGLNTGDIPYLEKLEDPRVLRRLPEGRRHLKRNERDDVILYMRTWADLLAEELDSRESKAKAPRITQVEAVADLRTPVGRA